MKSEASTDKVNSPKFWYFELFDFLKDKSAQKQ